MGCFSLQGTIAFQPEEIMRWQTCPNQLPSTQYNVYLLCHFLRLLSQSQSPHSCLPAPLRLLQLQLSHLPQRDGNDWVPLPAVLQPGIQGTLRSMAARSEVCHAMVPQVARLCDHAPNCH